MADPDIRVRIAADLEGVRRNLRELTREVGGFKAATERGTRAAARSVVPLEKGLQGAVVQARRLVGAFAAFVGVRAFVGLADQAATLQARLRLATNDQEQFNLAVGALFDIAQRTRSSLEATIDLYARLERSTRALNLNQRQLLALTETINQAAQISGGGPGAEAALFQLSQGLAAGQLRGEELNSVLEQTPRIAQALADGLGIPLGQLRELAKQGKLTAEEVARAFVSQRDVIAREFAELPQTVSGGLTQLRNSAVAVIGELDRASGAVGGIGSGLRDAADAIAEADFSGLVSVLSSVGGAVRAAIGGFRALADEVGSRLVAVIGEDGAAAAFDFLGFTVRNLPAIIVAAVKRAIVELAAFADDVVNTARAVAEGTAALFTDDTRAAADARRRQRAAAIARERRESVAAIDAELNATIAAGEAAVERYRRERQARRDAQAAARAAGPVDPIAGTGGASALAGAAADAGELLRANVASSIRELDRLYEAGEVGLRDYFGTKRALELAAIDSELAAARAAVDAADTIEKRKKALTELALLEQRRAETAAAGARAQAEAERELARALEDVRARVAEAEGQRGATALLALERERDALLARFANDPNAAEWIRRLFDIEVAREQLSGIEAEVEATLARLRDTESNVAVQVEAGVLGQVEGERQLQDVREATIAQLRTLRDELAALAATQTGAEADATRAALAAVEGEIARIQSSAAILRNQARDLTATGLTDFFDDLATGAKSAGDAFRDLVRGFVAGITRMAAEAVAKRAALALFGGGGGGGLADVLAGVFHDGGIVGAPGRTRRVPALAFAGAPRFHSGGVAGLAPNEVPAILERGERVLSREEVARRAERPAINLNFSIATPDGRVPLATQQQIAAAAMRGLVQAQRRNG